MVELRKRKAASEAAPPPVKKANSVKSTSSNKKAETSLNGSSSVKTVALGETVDLDGFGGEVETNDGVKVTLKKLLEDCKKGVILFTYPKASTPGCTTQACLFRDDFESLTATGFSIYGLSTDTPKSNMNFKTKQNLPYTLLCDPSATLIKAIGMKKTPTGTTRGVFIINKGAKVEAVSPGGPAATVDVVRKFVGAGDNTSGDVGSLAEGEKIEKGTEAAETNAQEVEQQDGTNGDEAKAEVAAEVADSAEKLDGEAET